MKYLITLLSLLVTASAAQTCNQTIGGPACTGGLGSVCVNLSWTAPGSVAGYNVYRGSTANGESTTPINNALVTSTTFQDDNLPSGATVEYYKVTAVNSGGQSSAYSNESCAQISMPPAAPTNLQASPQ